MNSRLSHINAFILLLSSEIKNKDISINNFKNITKRDVFFTNGGCVKTAKFNASYSLEKVMIREDYTYNPQAPVIWDERLSPLKRLMELPTEVFDNSVAVYKKLCTDDEAVYLLSDIHKALTLFDNGDYGNCLILLWSHLEIHYKELYLQCFKSVNPRVGISRALECLQDQGKLSLETFERINALKEIRNTIIHHDTNTDVSFQNCLELFDLVYDIANEKYQVELNSDLYTLV